MDISLITSQSLLQLLSLAEKKEELIQIIAEVDAEITRTLKGGAVSVVEVFEMPASQPAIAKPAPAAGQPVAAAQAPAKSGRSGGLKSRVLALLDAAGPRGLRVKEIAEKLGASSSNISVWFSTTGKKLTTKIEPGRYAAKAGESLKQGKMSAEGRAKIAALMKARWAARRAGKPAAPIAAAKPAQVAAPAKTAKASKKSKMSAEGRARISAATTARWAVRRAGKGAAPIAAGKPAQVAAPAKTAKASKKSKMSAEGRARISAATTARWAARRAAKTSAVSRPTKTTKTYKLL